MAPTSKVPYVVAAAVAAAGLLGFQATRAGAAERATLTLVSDSGAAMAAFAAAVPRAEATVRAVATTPEGQPLDAAAFERWTPALRDETAIYAGALVDAATGNLRSASAAGPISWPYVLDRPGVVTALAVARDRGTLITSAPVRMGDRLVAVLAVPQFRGAVAGTADRRAAIDAFVVAVIDPRRLASETFGEAFGRDINVVIADGDIDMVSGRTHAPSISSDMLRGEVAIGNREWQVAVGGPPVSPPTVSWLLLVLGLGLSAVIAVSTRMAARRERQTVNDATARARELELVVGAGTLLQESLELADVLPAFAVRLVDELDLTSVAVATADASGNLVDVFVTGVAARTGAARVTELGPPPPEAPAGEWITVPLERDRRTIGALCILPRHALDRPQMNAIRAAAELLAAALANADLYLREQDTVRRLQELDGMKTAFLGTVSHELRTPLVAIRGFAELLQQQWDALDDPARRDFVDRIARNAISLSALVQDVLDFARLERQAVQVAVEELDLSDRVEQVVRQMGASFDGHPVSVEVDGGLRAWSDGNAVERILSNLLSNALKFSPPGSPVVVGLHSAGDSVVLTVDDAGPGVAPGVRERIFERFYRGDTTEAIRTKGAGIGLAIVKELAARVDASVAVDESPLGGARFSVRFPARFASSELAAPSRRLP